MGADMRKEIKNGVLFFSLFNIINLINIVIGKDIPILHFCCGVLAVLAFLQVIIGLLPESIYHEFVEICNFKKATIYRSFSFHCKSNNARYKI